MAIAVGHLALVVPQGALLALPSRVADALPVGVFAVLGAQHGAHALAAVVAPEAWVALAVPQQALSVAGAAVGAVLGHFLGHGRVEGQLLHVPVVVVERYEPVPRFHVARHLPGYRQLHGISVCEAYDRASDGCSGGCVMMGVHEKTRLELVNYREQGHAEAGYLRERPGPFVCWR